MIASTRVLVSLFRRRAGGQGAKQKGLCADLPVTEPVVVTECLVGYLVEVHCFGRGIRRSGNILLRSPT